MKKLKVLLFCLPLLALDILISWFTERSFEDENKITIDALKAIWHDKQ